MPVQAKVVSLAAMWAGITMSAVLIGESLPAVRVVVIGLGICGTLAIWLSRGRIRGGAVGAAAS